MWFTYKINTDGTIVYTESFRDSLKTFYKGVKGYVYKCDIKGDTDNKSKIKTAITVFDDLPVSSVDVIEDVYETIIELEREGKVIIRRYDELTSDEINSNHKMVFNAIKNLDMLEYKHPASYFVERTFPDIWEEVKQTIEDNI